MDRFRDQDDGEDAPEDPRLRALRWLVTGLTAVLVVGVVAIIALLVTKIIATPQSARLTLPDRLTLPEGESARAATFGQGWVLVVTADGEGRERLRLFDAETGAARQVVEVVPGP